MRIYNTAKYFPFPPQKNLSSTGVSWTSIPCKSDVEQVTLLPVLWFVPGLQGKGQAADVEVVLNKKEM